MYSCTSCALSNRELPFYVLLYYNNLQGHTAGILEEPSWLF